MWKRFDRICVIFLRQHTYASVFEKKIHISKFTWEYKGHDLTCSFTCCNVNTKVLNHVYIQVSCILTALYKYFWDRTGVDPESDWGGETLFEAGVWRPNWCLQWVQGEAMVGTMGRRPGSSYVLEILQAWKAHLPRNHFYIVNGANY
jgi:hypothetical protein